LRLGSAGRHNSAVPGLFTFRDTLTIPRLEKEMPQTNYAFRVGRAKGASSFYREFDPQRIGEHIEELSDKYKEHLTKEEVLADARRSHSPLHKLFDWDDGEAAERWRRRQVGMLMGSLVVRKKGKPTRTRAFVFVRVAKHGRSCYMPLRSALGQPDLRDQVITRGMRHLENWIDVLRRTPCDASLSALRRSTPQAHAARDAWS
jgi:hypothetical protein